MVGFFEIVLIFNFWLVDVVLFIYVILFDGFDVMFVYLDFDMLYGKFELCYKIYKLCDVFNEFDIYDVVYIDMLFVLNFYMCLVLIVVECCLILFDCDDFLCCVLYMLFENVKEI